MCKPSVKYVKDRRQFEATCQCGEWFAGGPTEEAVLRQHPIHLALRANK